MRDYNGYKIAVIGDFMVDIWLTSDDILLSSEAPVPIVRNGVEVWTVGGAGNVVMNVSRLGAECHMYGRVGKRDAGEFILRAFDEYDRCTSNIMRNGAARTTTKTRIIGRGQQIIRIDKDDDFKSGGEETLIFHSLELDMAEEGFDAIIIADYNKGVMSKPMILAVIGAAKRYNIPVMVDAKYDNFWEYKGVTIFKCNQKEWDARPLRKNYSEPAKIDLGHIVITRGGKGMEVLPHGCLGTEHKQIESFSGGKVVDATGAGDVVIATLTLEYLRTGDIMDAVRFANIAGGLSVLQHGTTQLTVEEIEEAEAEWL